MSDFLASVREGDRTAYLATLFAPEPIRPALFALAAYGLELKRIVSNAVDPLAAEVRLQWWRDAIRNEGYGADAPVPLVMALREAMDAYTWPADTLCAISEGRIHDLYADPFPDTDAFDGYAGEVFAAPLQLAALAFGIHRLGMADGAQAARSAATAAGYGGIALAAADAAEREAVRIRAGRTHIPLSLWQSAGIGDIAPWLSKARPPTETPAAIAKLVAHGLAADAGMREAIAALTPVLRGALLPAMTARRRLKAVMRRPMAPSTPGPLTIQWTLWRSARAFNKDVRPSG
ncbi:MAG: squalene/phytoene synthase family protein [Pseudomonadota bacterium]